MIHHIVVWKLNERGRAERDSVITRFGTELSALVGAVPGLVAVTLGVDRGDTDGNWDVSLMSVHESAEALSTYQTHPDHVTIGTWFKGYVESRAAVDSEH